MLRTVSLSKAAEILALVEPEAEVVKWVTVYQPARSQRIFAKANLSTDGYIAPKIEILAFGDVSVLGENGLLKHASGDYVDLGIPHKMFLDLENGILNQNHQNFAKSDAPERKLDREAILAASPYAHNYYHWHFNILVSLSAIQDAGMLAGRYVLTQPLKSWQRVSLLALGVREEQVIEMQASERYVAPALLSASFMSRHGHRKSPSATKVFSKIKAGLGIPASPAASPANRKVYISRALAPARPMRNEADLERALRELGYEVARLETLSYAEQAALLSQTSQIMGPHGAGLTNMGFMPPGGAAHELCSSRTRTLVFMGLAYINKFVYAHTMSFDAEPLHAVKNFTGWRVDIEQVLGVDQKVTELLNDAI